MASWADADDQRGDSGLLQDRRRYRGHARLPPWRVCHQWTSSTRASPSGTATTPPASTADPAHDDFVQPRWRELDANYANVVAGTDTRYEVTFTPVRASPSTMASRGTPRARQTSITSWVATVLALRPRMAPDGAAGPSRACTTGWASRSRSTDGRRSARCSSS